MTAATRTSVKARSSSETRLLTGRSRLGWKVTVSTAVKAAGAEAKGAFRRWRWRRTLKPRAAKLALIEFNRS